MRDVYLKLWSEMLNSEMTGEYFSVLAGRYSTIDTSLKIFLAITSSSVIAGWSFIKNTEQYPVITGLWQVVTSIAVITSIVLPFLNLSKKSEWAGSLKTAYASSAQDYEFLWLKRESMSRERLISAMLHIVNKEKSLSGLEVNFQKINQRLLKRCQQIVIQRRSLTDAQ